MAFFVVFTRKKLQVRSFFSSSLHWLIDLILEGDVTITGEDAGLMKGLTTPAIVVDIPPPSYSPEPPSLVIDSTKPVYPRLEQI